MSGTSPKRLGEVTRLRTILTWIKRLRFLSSPPPSPSPAYTIRALEQEVPAGGILFGKSGDYFFSRDSLRCYPFTRLLNCQYYVRNWILDRDYLGSLGYALCFCLCQTVQTRAAVHRESLNFFWPFELWWDVSTYWFWAIILIERKFGNWPSCWDSTIYFVMWFYENKFFTNSAWNGTIVVAHCELVGTIKELN